MKKIFNILGLLIFSFFCFACNENVDDNKDKDPSDIPGGIVDDEPNDGDEDDDGDDDGDDDEETEISDEAIKAWLDKLYKDKEISSNVDIPEYYKDTEIMLFFEPEHKAYVKNNGKFNAPLLDTYSTFTFYYDIPYEENGEILYFAGEHNVSVLLKGYGNEAVATLDYIQNSLPTEIDDNYDFPLTYEKYSAQISYYYNGNLLENGTFTVEKDLKESFYATINVVVIAKGNTEQREMTIFVSHLNSEEKMQEIEDYLVAMYATSTIDGDIDLPYVDELYGAKISWRSWVPHILTDRGKFTKPLKSATVTMMATVTLKTDVLTMFNVSFNVVGEDKTTQWDKIETFLNSIALSNVKNQKFTLYGYETKALGFDDDYTAVPSYNYGYIPFYTTNSLKVTQAIISKDHVAGSNPMRSSTNYITLHNTGMAQPKANAAFLSQSINNQLEREASWHFSVDDYEAYQQVDLNMVAWHAGDSGNKYGDIYYNTTYNKWSIGGGNSNSIGIETCVYKGCDYNMVMRNTAKLVAPLLVQYNLTTTDIRQHYDFSGKDCPQVLRHSGRWAEQIWLIELEYYGITELAGVEFEWTSLTPEYLDNNGVISITRPNEETQVSYKVKVTYNGESKEYKFTSTLSKLSFTVEGEK